MTRKPVHIGIIGVGAWGSNHARVLSSVPEAELIGFYDPDKTRGAAAVDSFGGRLFDSAEELFDQVEAVTVAAPTTLHHSITLEALRHGVHVLVEKPIAVSVEEAEEMEKAARKAERVLAVGHLERFNPAVEALLSMRLDPMFLEIHRLSPFGVRCLDVSVVLDLMIHDIDVILRLVGSPVESIEAVGVPVLSPAIDIANARLRFTNGCVANLTASRISLQKTRKIRIFEKNRYTSVNYTDQTVTLYERTGELPPPHELTPLSFQKLIRHEEAVVEKGEPLKIEILHFLKAVRGADAKIVNAVEATEALRTARQILDRMDAGHGAVR